VKRKIPNPSRESNPRTPIVQPIAGQMKQVHEERLLERAAHF